MQTVNTRSALEDIIRQYTLHFNRLNRQYHEFIETTEREDIFMAMKQLYEECILHSPYFGAEEPHTLPTLEEAWDIMDELRENW